MLLSWIIFIIVDKIKERVNMWPFKKKLKPEIGKKYVFQNEYPNPFEKLHIIIRVVDIKQDKKGKTWIAYHIEPYSKMYNELWNHRDWKEYMNE